MSRQKFCPKCGIGLSFIEREYGLCRNCKSMITKSEKEEQDSVWDDEDNFEYCDNCDLPDACSDFGCAIKNGLRYSVEL